MSALELCLDFVCHRLCGYSPSLHLLHVLFAHRQIEFFEVDLGMNQMWKIDHQKRFPVVQMHSMCQVASVCRGSAKNENLKSLLVEWEREKASHCDSIPLLEILHNRSQNSSVIAFGATGK